MNEKIEKSIAETQKNIEQIGQRYNELVSQRNEISEELEQCKNTINFLNGKLVALNELLAENQTTPADATEEIKA